MADTTKLRIGLQSARELELDVADAEASAQTLEDAVTGGDQMVAITDSRGHRFAIVVAKVVFIETESEGGTGGIGFGTSP